MVECKIEFKPGTSTRFATPVKSKSILGHSVKEIAIEPKKGGAGKSGDNSILQGPEKNNVFNSHFHAKNLEVNAHVVATKRQIHV